MTKGQYRRAQLTMDGPPEIPSSTHPNIGPEHHLSQRCEEATRSKIEQPWQIVQAIEVTVFPSLGNGHQMLSQTFGAKRSSEDLAMLLFGRSAIGSGTALEPLHDVGFEIPDDQLSHDPPFHGGAAVNDCSTTLGAT